MGRINKEPKGNIKTLKKEKLKAMGFRQERIEGMNQPKSICSSKRTDPEPGCPKTGTDPDPEHWLSNKVTKQKKQGSNYFCFTIEESRPDPDPYL
jgi:hypothetical protein